MEVPPGLLEPATEERLRQALSGKDVASRLPLGALQAGTTGIVEAAVRQVHPVRPYMRKNGGTGLIGKVTLADATGEAVLVLWDDETRLLQDGPFQPGAYLRMQGATVRAGRRGEPELALGAAVVTALEGEVAPPSRLEGTLLEVGPARVTGQPPALRFQADAQLQAPGGVAHIALEGEPLRSLRSILPGATVALEGVTAHPVLDGWWIAGPATVVRRL